MEILIISVLFLTAAYLSGRWAWWRKKTPGLPVLCYHKIGTPPPGSKLKELWVTPAKFRRQVKHLLDNDYKTLLFSELLAACKGTAPLPKKAVVITFDDGYENNYTQAWPILRELGAKGNIFVVFNTIGKANTWHDPASEPWINMATAEMLLEMKKSGVMELGSHTMNHPHLGALEPEDAAWEMRESKKQLEVLLGGEICAFAYPYGDGAYSPAVRAQALSAGYSLDFSFTQGKTFWPWDRQKGPLDRLFIQGDENNVDLALHLSRGASRLF
ncbi:MAG: polysaccharide deacetylase family protein [Elusimicrobia bacterium]|nr:polysaccharide deacetylase family protein [Elusimicrobiota bacterium]